MVLINTLDISNTYCSLKLMNKKFDRSSQGINSMHNLNINIACPYYIYTMCRHRVQYSLQQLIMLRLLDTQYNLAKLYFILVTETVCKSNIYWFISVCTEIILARQLEFYIALYICRENWEINEGKLRSTFSLYNDWHMIKNNFHHEINHMVLIITFFIMKSIIWYW